MLYAFNQKFIKRGQIYVQTRQVHFKLAYSINTYLHNDELELGKSLKVES